MQPRKYMRYDNYCQPRSRQKIYAKKVSALAIHLKLLDSSSIRKCRVEFLAPFYRRCLLGEAFHDTVDYKRLEASIWQLTAESGSRRPITPETSSLARSRCFKVAHFVH